MFYTIFLSLASRCTTLVTQEQLARYKLHPTQLVLSSWGEMSRIEVKHSAETHAGAWLDPEDEVPKLLASPNTNSTGAQAGDLCWAKWHMKLTDLITEFIIHSPSRTEGGLLIRLNCYRCIGKAAKCMRMFGVRIISLSRKAEEHCCQLDS